MPSSRPTNALSWLHLSDLHCCEPRTGWDAWKVLQTLKQDLEFFISEHNMTPDFLFFTGDVAFGEVPEMSIVEQFDKAEGLFKEIQMICNIPDANVFLVPGNHDVNRVKVSKGTSHWLNDLRKKNELDDIYRLFQEGGYDLSVIMERLSDYRDFLDRAGYKHLLAQGIGLIYAHRRQINGIVIGIAGLNSAWSCHGDDEHGRLWSACDWQIKSLEPVLEGAHVKIGLVHHPVSWFCEAEARKLETRFERFFDFHLHGHEHHSWVKVIGAMSRKTVRVAAGACYDRSDRANGYNLVRLDLETGRAEVWLRQYEDDSRGWIPRHVADETDTNGVWHINGLRCVEQYRIREKVQWALVLSAKIDDFDKFRIDSLLEHLRTFAKDPHITFKKIQESPTKIHFESTRQAFNRINLLMNEKKLDDLLKSLGLKVRDIILYKRQEATEERRQKALREKRRSAVDAVSASGGSVERIHLIYPCEDRSAVRQIVRACRAYGIDLTWDQDWMPWDDDHYRGISPLTEADVVVFYGSASFSQDHFLRKAYAQAVSLDTRILLLCQEGVELGDLEALPETTRFNAASGQSADTALLEYLQPAATLEISSPERGNVKSLLDEARKANLDIPTDTVTERIFLTPLAADLTERAFGARMSAVNLAAGDRFTADLEYARLLRFRGEWSTANDHLAVTWTAIGRKLDPDLRHLIHLERGALEFERGFIQEGIDKVGKALEHFERVGEIGPNLIKALRQLGNMIVEQGEWDRAGDLLNSALHLAGVLVSSSRRRGQRSLAASLLRIDCLRERGSFLLRKERIDEGLGNLDRALKEAENLGSVGHHLAGVLCYHIGRAHYLYTGKFRLAEEYLLRSLDILERYDNPVRVAFVFEHIARVRTRLSLSADEKVIRTYFERALRIRKACGHTYMAAKTQIGLGNYYFRKGDLNRAISEYEQARITCQNFGKKPELGRALYALGRSYARQNHPREARQSLESAELIFRDLNMTSTLREVEFELIRLEEPRLLEKTFDQILADGRAKNYDFHVNEVGEYALHNFIKMLVADMKKGGHDDAIMEVELGIGDDAAVIKIPEKFDLVLTTDAAPGSLCRSLEVDKGVYAAKFSVIHSLSDLLAMGATPVAVLLNLYMVRDAKLEYAKRVVETVRDELRRYNVALIGGDIKERREQSIGCVGVGLVPHGGQILREGARPGHVLAITQTRGESGELRRIGKRWAQEILESREGESPKVKFFLRDNWKEKLLFLPYNEMLCAARDGKLKSAIDTSDGFLACLQLLGKDSDVSFLLNEELIREVIDEEVCTMAEYLGFPPTQFLFNAGHDWEIVVTIPRNEFQSVRESVQNKTGGDLAQLGCAVKCSKYLKEKGGVAYQRSNGDVVRIPFFTDEKFVRRPYEERPLEWEDLKFYVEGGEALPEDEAELILKQCQKRD